MFIDEPCARSIIDYFKPSFNWSLDPSDQKTLDLFSFLKLEIDKYVEDDHLRDNMLEHRIYDQSVHVYLCPSDKSQRPGVLDYFTVELSGQACREFELRGGSWLDLSEFLVKNDTKLLQVHLARDALNGMIPFDELKRKVLSEEFISSFRRSKAGGSVAKTESSGSSCLRDESRYFYGLDYSDLRDSEFNDSVNIVNKVGWSATFGRRENVQLQIYDKLVERATQAGYKAPYRSWLRFEMRWGSDKADCVKSLLYDAFKHDRLDQLTSDLLYQLLDFKDVLLGSGRSNYNKLHTWQPWLDFLGSDADKVKVSTLSDYQSTVQRSKDWISYGVARTLLKLFIIDDGETLMNVLYSGIAAKMSQGKLDNRLVSEVNNYLRTQGTPEEELLDHVATLKRMFFIFKDLLDVDLAELINRSIDVRKGRPYGAFEVD